MAKILFIDGEKVTALEESEFTEERKLQDYLKDFPTLIPLEDVVEEAPELICIGKEVAVPSGALDLLFIDKNGLITVIETKLVNNPEIRREVIGQIIEYASYISHWSADKVYELANAYLKSDLDGYMLNKYPDNYSPEDFRLKIEQNLEGGRVRLIIAVDKLVEPLRSTVTFLNHNCKFDILLLEVSSFEGRERGKVLTSSLFGYISKTTARQPKKQWNLDEFLSDAQRRCGKERFEVIKQILDFTTQNSEGGILWGKAEHTALLLSASKSKVFFHQSFLCILMERSS